MTIDVLYAGWSIASEFVQALLPYKTVSCLGDDLLFPLRC